MSEQRFLYRHAMAVAEEVRAVLAPGCERIEIAGSLRREKPDVGDIEILFVPLIQEHPREGSLFGETDPLDCAALLIETLVDVGKLELRLNRKDSHTYGPLNKLMRHVASGIPVDLFATTGENWFNALVCRTGPAELNKAIAAAAIARGWHWNVYGRGFSRPAGNTRETEVHPVTSERGVFEFVGIQYMEPEARK